MPDFTILFSADVSAQSANNFAQMLANLASNKVTRLFLGINSSGGNVVSGVFLYNLLKSAPYEVVTHNVGNVDSIANVVFLGGSRRIAAASSTFMFHSVGFEPNPNERLEEKNLIEKLDTINAEHTRISQILADRTKLTVDVGLELFRQQRTKNAGWALDNGLVHDVGEFAMPADGTFHPFFG